MRRVFALCPIALAALAIPASAQAQSAPVTNEMSASVTVGEALSAALVEDIRFCSIAAGQFLTGQLVVNFDETCTVTGSNLEIVNDGTQPGFGWVTVAGPPNTNISLRASVTTDFEDSALNLDVVGIAQAYIESNGLSDRIPVGPPTVNVYGTLEPGTYTATVTATIFIQ